jgi:hypothetical protein
MHPESAIIVTHMFQDICSGSHGSTEDEPFCMDPASGSVHFVLHALPPGAEGTVSESVQFSVPYRSLSRLISLKDPLEYGHKVMEWDEWGPRHCAVASLPRTELALPSMGMKLFSHAGRVTILHHEVERLYLARSQTCRPAYTTLTSEGYRDGMELDSWIFRNNVSSQVPSWSNIRELGDLQLGLVSTAYPMEDHIVIVTRVCYYHENCATDTKIMSRSDVVAYIEYLQYNY